jgi:predicted enzyme related to lactoylglutathione lyase
MAHHPVNWFAITGPNGKELQKFYKRLFSWEMKPLPGPGDMVMVSAERDGISGGVGTSQNGQASVALYVTVGDIAAYLAKAHEAGGQMAMPPMDLPNDMGRIAGISDPAGNWIGIWQAPSKGPAPSAPKKKVAGAPKKKAKAAAKTAAKTTKKAAAKKPAKKKRA